MKTITEFSGFALNDALTKIAELTAAGKTPEEVEAGIGEAFKREGDKLKLLMNAVEMAKTRPQGIKRIVLLTLAEGEKAPQGAQQKDEHYYLMEFFPTPPSQNKGGRGGKFEGRGDRDGKGRGKGRGGRGGKGGRDDKGRGGERGAGGERSARPRRGEGEKTNKTVITIVGAPNSVGAAPGGEGADATQRPRRPRPPRKPKEPLANKIPVDPAKLPKPLSTPIKAEAKTESSSDNSSTPTS